MKGDLRRWLRGAVIGVVAGVVAVAATQLPLAETYENRTFDVRTRLFADPRRADPEIVAVVIDQKALDTAAKRRAEGGFEQGWPWPRDYYAEVVTYLTRAGARAVVFDVTFSEQSIYTTLGDADDDNALANATRRGRVVHAVKLEREELANADRAWAPGLRQAPLTMRRSPVPERSLNKATPPIPSILDAAAAIGSINFDPDDDGVARALYPVATYAPTASTDARAIWSLPFATAAVIGARIDLEGKGANQTIRVNGRAIHLDEDGRMVLRFHGREGTYRQVTYTEVFRSAMVAAEGGTPTLAGTRLEDFRGKIVIIGATATGLLDLRVTPVAAVTPGYVIHATALDNLLHADAMSRVTTRTRVLTVLALALVCGVLGMLRVARAGFVAVAGVIALYVGAAVWLFDTRGLWLDLVGPALGIALAWAGSTGYAYLTEGRERRFLRDAFSRYLAPDVVSELVSQPGRLALGGEKRELTIMFADVAGFTTLSEGRDPREVVTLMNECFASLTGVIQAEGGTVDKFIGDAVMAFWNAPVAQADHATRALRAARKLLLAVERVNAAWASRGLPKLGMRVGVATGPAVVGNVGSLTKFNYTVMGDTVNLASRLEGAAKQYHTTSMISDATAAAAGNAVPLRELDRISVKGRAEALAVFEVVPDHDPVSAHAEALRTYAKALEVYRARAFSEAAALFEAVLALSPDDGPSLEMRERCHELAANPPSAGWRGEHVLTSK